MQKNKRKCFDTKKVKTTRKYFQKISYENDAKNTYQPCLQTKWYIFKFVNYFYGKIFKLLKKNWHK
jgi:hypothetical protein